MQEFWERWDKANEIEKVELVKSLTIIDKNKRMIHKGFEYAMASLLNSYFVDLAEYIRESKEVK